MTNAVTVTFDSSVIVAPEERLAASVRILKESGLETENAVQTAHDLQCKRGTAGYTRAIHNLRRAGLISHGTWRDTAAF